MEMVVLEAVGGTVATLVTSGLTWFSVHLKQIKRGLSKKKLAERLDKLEKRAEEMDNAIKNFDQKMDLVIELIRTNKINRKKKVTVKNEKDN